MTDPVKEQISACLDGELPKAELDLLVKQVGRDPELGQTLSRYALIGEALRGRGAVAAPADFASRVAAAIAAEPALDAAPSTQPLFPAARWLRPAAGIAVAASAAIAAILILKPASQSPDVAYMPESTAAVTPEPTVADPSYIVPASTASGYVPAARLTNYVVAHSEYSTPLGRRSVLSSVLSEEEDDESVDLQPEDADPRQ
jgi:sigma-E factor negative regulatory protein RseA